MDGTTSRFIGCCVALLAVTTVSVLVVAAPASAKLAVAAPGSGKVIAAPSGPVTPDPNDKQHQVAVQSYIDQHGVSEQVAAEHLSRMGRVDDPKEKLVVKLGDDFAQLYFDNDSGRYVVAVSPAGSDAAALKAAADVGIGDVGVAHRAYNHRQLDADVTAVTKRAEQLIERGVMTVAVSRDGIDVEVAAGVSNGDVNDVKAASGKTPDRAAQRPRSGDRAQARSRLLEWPVLRQPDRR